MRKYPNINDKYPSSKEEFLDKWKDDPKVSDDALDERYRWQRAIIMEGYHRIHDTTMEETIRYWNRFK
jgi:hypothetical protein